MKAIDKNIPILRVLLAVATACSLVALPACSSGSQGDSEASSATAVSEEMPTVPTKTVPEIADMLDDGNVAVIDVRTPEEYVLGHLFGAMNIDFYSDDFSQNLDTLDRDRTYVVYCRCGVRGAKSVAAMQEIGFQDVYNMEGGYLEWEYERQPIER